MGKKSRKKKSSNKESHQDRMKERATRREEERIAAEEELEEVNDDANDEDRLAYGGKPRPFLDGDFVRYCDPSHEHGMVRGVIHRKVDGSDEELPEGKFQFTAYEENAVVKIVDVEDIWTDLHFTQLRYKVGDHVLCYNRDHRDDAEFGEWIRHEVIELWPYSPEVYNWSVLSRAYPSYLCKPEVDLGYLLPIYDDLSDHEIRDIPLSTRFDVGDKVVFNAGYAEPIKLSGRYLGSGWREGKIVDTIPTQNKQKGRKGPKYTVYLGFYECSFQHKGKVHRCFILEDSDEHIARDDPRTRLMNAIEDDCSMEHISYLVDEFGIDVPAFQDSFISAAVDLGSYNALWWIQENLGLELAAIMKSGGDTMLKRFASSRHIMAFMQKVIGQDQLQYQSGIKDIRKVFLRMRDDANRNLFLMLVMKSDLRALDFALSPLALGNQFAYSELIQITLVDTIEDLKRTVSPSIIWQIRYIVDRFKAYTILAQFTEAFLDEEVVRREYFQGLEAKPRMRQYLRYCWDYRLIDVGHCDFDNPCPMKREKFKPLSDFQSLGRTRDYNVLHLMIEEDPTLLDAPDSFFLLVTRTDQGEFGHPNLRKREFRDKGSHSYVSLVDLIVHGESEMLSDYNWEVRKYNRCLQEFLKKQDFDPKEWVGELTTMICSMRQDESYIDPSIQTFKRKVALMTDDDNVEDQWRLLDFLVKEKGRCHPSLVPAIAYRQCSVVRWLLQRGYTTLTGEMEPELESHVGTTIDVAFGLGHSTGAWRQNKVFLLCLLTIQYDDIQTLNWFIDQHGAEILADATADFNLVHAAAHFGRIEIMHYLSTWSTFASFVMKSVGDGNYKGAYATHVAVSCGHVLIAEMLLSHGCPVVDMNSVSIGEMASKSSHGFVQRWASEVLASSQLEQDLNLLMSLAKDESTSLDVLKDHVLRSKCMDVETWRDVDCWLMDESGELSFSYVSIFRGCLEVGAVDFSLWLCTRTISRNRIHSMILENTFFGDKEDNVGYIEVPLSEFFNAEQLSFLVGSSLPLSVRVRNYATDPHPLMQLFLQDKLKDKLVAMVTRLDVVRELHKQSLREIPRLLFSQSGDKRLRSLVEFVVICAKMIEQEGEPFSDEFTGVTNSGEINFNAFYYRKHDSTKSESLRRHVWVPRNLDRLHLLLPIDGDVDVIGFCLKNNRNLNLRKVVTMTYLASCFDRNDVVDLLLDETTVLPHPTSLHDRSWHAALGALERGRFDDLHGYLENAEKIVDPIKVEYTKYLGGDFPSTSPPIRQQEDDPEHERHIQTVYMAEVSKSMCYFYIHGFLIRYGRSSSERSCDLIPACQNEINDFVAFGAYEKRHILLGAIWILHRPYFLEAVETIQGLLHLVDCLGVCHRCTSEERKLLQRLTSSIVSLIESHLFISEKGIDWNAVLSMWIDKMSSVGIAMEFDATDARWLRREDAREIMQRLQGQQEYIFQQFDSLKKGCSVKDLQDAISRGFLDAKACDRGGLYLVHIAAAYDRVDVLEWLVGASIVRLDQLDAHGRTALKVAESSKAKSATNWIRQRNASLVISKFFSIGLCRKRGRRRMSSIRHGISKLQAMCRGWSVRQATSTQILMHVESSRMFQLIWGKCYDLIGNTTSGAERWSVVRDSIVDFVNTSEEEQADDTDDGNNITRDVSDDMIETLEVLEVAMENVQDTGFDDAPDHPNADDTEATKVIRAMTYQDTSKSTDTTAAKTIQYTPHIVKWLKQGDPKYRDFFVRRITQLSHGERSRILAKRLKGSKAVTIYETYLEQKSGFRILWTEEGDDMLVWYVAKHDNVSRMVRLIDESAARGNRQLVPAVRSVDSNHVGLTASEKVDHMHPSRIMLDPMGNVPMKVYQFGGIDEVGQVVEDSWTPRLKLTDEERDIVETKGTVLLLGRSGTGKTVCILSRMEYDHQVNIRDSTFTQLFVARSRRLCKYVSETLGHTQNPNGNTNFDTTNTSMTFTTFDELLSRLENALPRVENIRDMFRRSERMTFQRFKTEVYSDENGIEPLLVWACIRSFVKGSIEAATQTNNLVVDRQSFLNLEKFGSRRCRLSVDEQRPIVYDIYEKYHRYMQEYNLWDDCDRIMALLQRLESSKTTAPDIYHQVRKRKVYVDEIQDYTQAECLLFFYLSGPGDLFLAGDPAQSVVEGVEFRFEDIRSVEYHIAKDKSGLLLHKPKTVNVNYRSHAGILNTAGAILSCMFGAFPHSAKQLKEDRGVFVGPRPGVLYKVSTEMVESVIKSKLNGTVILVHDSSVSRWRRALGGYALVYGIRAAKGLEFKSVMVLGFFGELPVGIHKPWRDLLLGRADDGYQNAYPEVEGHMKLLYTAVTRSIERLFFVETEGSVAGDAFVRWITTTSMARNKNRNGRVSQSVSSTPSPLVPLASRNKVDDVESMTMTKDEWLSSGMDNAEAAEIEEDLSAAESLWDKAIYCFREAQDHDLASKARTHRASVRFQMTLPVLTGRGNQKSETSVEEDAQSEYRMLEVEGADIVESLLREGLVEEAKNLCLLLIPYMSEESVEHFDRKIMRRL